MNFFCRILYWIAMLFCIIWLLLLLLLKILLFPVLYFLPTTIIENFDRTVTRIALKFLWFIWRVIKCSFFIVFGLVLIPLTPVLIFWARLCGNLWAWIVSGGKPTLETKKLVFSVLGVFGFFLMIIFGILGLVISCLSGEFLASLIGGVGGFIIWLYPTVDCFDLEKKAEDELNLANRPYYFADSCSSQKILFTVSSSAPPSECVKDSDSASQPLSSSESDCYGNAPRS